MRHVIVTVCAPFRSREERPVDDGCVVEFVHQNQVAWSGETGDDCEVGHIAARIHTRVFTLTEGGDAGLKTFMQVVGSGEESHAACARSVLLNRCARRSIDAGVADEAEVAVRRQHDHVTTVRHGGAMIHRSDRGLQVEVAVPLDQRCSACCEFNDAGVDTITSKRCLKHAAVPSSARRRGTVYTNLCTSYHQGS